MTKGAEESGRYGLTLTRGLAILRTFSITNTALSATELSKRTGIPQPTVWRLCKTLQAEGYLTTEGSTSRFRPGLALLSLGVSAVSQFSLAQHARQHLTELATRFSVVAGMAMREGLHMRIIDRHQSPNAFVTYNVHIGSSLPLWSSASGWAYLAGLHAAGRAEVIAQIEAAHPDEWASAKDGFARAMAEFERTGIIITSGVFGGGLTAVGIPIVAPNSEAIYAIYCSAISSLLPEHMVEQGLGPRMIEIAGELSLALALER